MVIHYNEKEILYVSIVHHETSFVAITKRFVQ